MSSFLRDFFLFTFFRRIYNYFFAAPTPRHTPAPQADRQAEAEEREWLFRNEEAPRSSHSSHYEPRDHDYSYRREPEPTYDYDTELDEMEEYDDF